MQKANLSWDLTPLLKNDSDTEIGSQIKKIELEAGKFVDLWKNNPEYLSNPKVLKTALDEFELWERNFGTGGNVWYYFHLRSAQNKLDPKIKAWQNRANDLSIKLENNSQFFLLNLSKISELKQKEFLSDNALLPYHHFLENLFKNAKHLLSEPEEKILNLKSIPAYANWVKMTSTFLAGETREVLNESGKKQVTSFSQIASLMNSQKKKVRNEAVKAFNEILAKHVDTAENELNSILADKKVNDELRHFSRPDEGRHIADDVENETVDTLINSVNANNSLAHRFYQLKAKLFKVPKLAYHERNVEYGDVEKEYTFDQSAELVKRVFQKLDPEFEQIFSGFLQHKQIDVLPAKGKESGAFCVYYLKSQPTYILLNHTDKLRDVLTLAHELGHGINNELIKLKQNSLNFGTPLSTAEVASTFMEDFVLQELIKNADEETQLSLMMSKLNDDISSIFRQIACYRFEQELHDEFLKAGYLPKEVIGKIFQKHMAAYMGPAVKQDAGSENWWVYWSHIRNFFYVYSYASGLLISKSLQASVKKDAKFIINVKDFLSAGMSDSPKNIFSKLGIDITDTKFWEQGIGEIENLLIETESLAIKLGKI